MTFARFSWKQSIGDGVIAAVWAALRADVCYPHAGTIVKFLAFDAPLPFAARVLTPALGKLTAIVTGLEGFQSFILLEILFMWAFLAGMRFALAAMLPKPAASLGAVVAALLLVPAVFISGITPPVYFPYDTSSAAFMAWGLGCLLRERYQSLAGLIVLATLNRETSVLLVLSAGCLLFGRIAWRRFFSVMLMLSAAFAIPRGIVLWCTKDQPAPYGGALPLWEKGSLLFDGNIAWLLQSSHVLLLLAYLCCIPLGLLLLQPHIHSWLKPLGIVLSANFGLLLFSGKIEESRIFVEWIVVACCVLLPTAFAAAGMTTLQPAIGKNESHSTPASQALLKFGHAGVFIAAAIAYVLLHC